MFAQTHLSHACAGAGFCREPAPFIPLHASSRQTERVNLTRFGAALPKEADHVAS